MNDKSKVSLNKGKLKKKKLVYDKSNGPAAAASPSKQNKEDSDEYYDDYFPSTQDQPEVSWDWKTSEKVETFNSPRTPKASRATVEKRTSNSPLVYLPQKRKFIKKEVNLHDRDLLKSNLMKLTKEMKESPPGVIEEEGPCDDDDEDKVNCLETRDSQVEIIDIPDDLLCAYDESFDASSDDANVNNNIPNENDHFDMNRGKTGDNNMKVDDKNRKVVEVKSPLENRNKNITPASGKKSMVNKCSQDVQEKLRISPPTSLNLPTNTNQSKPNNIYCNNNSNTFKLKPCYQSYNVKQSTPKKAKPPIGPQTKKSCDYILKMKRIKSDSAITVKKDQVLEDSVLDFPEFDPDLDAILARPQNLIEPYVPPKTTKGSISRVSSLISRDSGKSPTVSLTSSSNTTQSTGEVYLASVKSNLPGEDSTAASIDDQRKRFFKSKCTSFENNCTNNNKLITNFGSNSRTVSIKQSSDNQDTNNFNLKNSTINNIINPNRVAEKEKLNDLNKLLERNPSNLVKSTSTSSQQRLYSQEEIEKKRLEARKKLLEKQKMNKNVNNINLIKK